MAVAELKEEAKSVWVFFVLLRALLALQPKHEGKKAKSEAMGVAKKGELTESPASPGRKTTSTT